MFKQKPIILIVDDSPNHLEPVTNLMSAESKIYFALNLIEAAELIPVIEPDLLVVNIFMAAMEKFSLCGQVKQNDALYNTPVLFLTRSDSDLTNIKTLNLNFFDFITYPIDPYRVSIRMKNCLTFKQVHSDHMKNVQTDVAGLSNAGYIEKIIKLEWLRAMRSKAPLSIIKIEIDDYSTITEKLQHDEVEDGIKQIADSLQELFGRTADSVARYTQSQFVCVLPETDKEGLEILSNDVVDDISSLRIRREFSSDTRHWTASVAGAMITPSAEYDISVLLSTIDILLAEAKAKGGNCVRRRKIYSDEAVTQLSGY